MLPILVILAVSAFHPLFFYEGHHAAFFVVGKLSKNIGMCSFQVNQQLRMF